MTTANQDAGYDYFLTLGQSSSRKKKALNYKPTFDIKISGLNTACANVYLQTNAAQCRSFYNNAISTDVAEMTRYVNYTGHPVVVHSRNNLPQLIQPIEKPEGVDSALLIVKHFFFKDNESYNLVDNYMASLISRGGDVTAEDEAIIRSYRDGFSTSSRVLTITYGYEAERVRVDEGVYDPLLDLFIYPYRGSVATSSHPNHDLNSGSALTNRTGKILKSGVFFCLSSSTYQVLYVKLSTGVTAVKAHRGQPVVVPGRQPGSNPQTVTEYIKVINVDSDGRETVRHYPLWRAFEEFGFFQTQKDAEDYGKYALSETAAWKEEQAKHERQLQALAAEARIESDRRVHEAKIAADALIAEASARALQQQNNMRLDHERILQAINEEKANLVKEIQRQKAELEMSLAREKAENDKREAEHKARLEAIKMEQARQEYSYSSSASSMKNTGEGIKLGVAIVGAVAAIGTLIWKTFF